MLVEKLEILIKIILEGISQPEENMYLYSADSLNSGKFNHFYLIIYPLVSYNNVL